MIVLEGPDGAGKTTLLTHLQNTFPHIHTHERFSSSVDGPKDALDVLVLNDMKSYEQRAPQFYDRHPFISEFIYGPILRGSIKDNIHRGEVGRLRKQFADDALIILCLPSYRRVWMNVDSSQDGQMAGVWANLSAIYNGYNDLHRMWPNVVWYDYTVHGTGYVEAEVYAYYERKKTERGIS